MSSLLPVFEEFLKDAPQDASYDSVRQSVVILMGSLAKHLDKNDPKVKPIVAKLITALSTPSQQVNISSCFPTTYLQFSECLASVSVSVTSLVLFDTSHTLILALLMTERIHSTHVVCHLSSGPGVCGQLLTSFSPCHQGGCCRDRKKPAAAAAGERQVC